MNGKAPVTTQRTLTGTVVSASMNKTITVVVDRKKMNEKYQKRFTVSKKFHVHDEKGTAKKGDTVVFVECRPMSKTKRWRLVSTNQENQKTKKLK